MADALRRRCRRRRRRCSPDARRRQRPSPPRGTARHPRPEARGERGGDLETLAPRELAVEGGGGGREVALRV